MDVMLVLVLLPAKIIMINPKKYHNRQVTMDDLTDSDRELRS